MSKLLLQRILHPVGQGGFYTEQFMNKEEDFDNSVLFNVVYDCGSKEKNLLDKTIDYTFPKKKSEIDILFLSHFDEDHVNGVEYLGKRVQKIKCVVMPLLKASQKVMAFLNCQIDFFNMPSFKVIHNIDKVVFIKGVETSSSELENSSRNRERNLNNINREYRNVINVEDTEDLEILSSGTPLSLIHLDSRKPTKEWIYIPFNICDESEYDEFKKFLQSDDSDLAEKLTKFIEGFEFENGSGKVSKFRLSEWDEIKKGLRKIYDKYIKEKSQNLTNRNDSSMIVYSGPIENNVEIRNGGWKVKSMMEGGFFLKSLMQKAKEKKLVASLYTGDIDLNMNIGSLKLYEYIHTKLQDYAVNLGLIQVPHHGSKHNFNTWLTGKFSQVPVFFYSFGLGNSYGHPFPGVRMWLYHDKKKVFEITEDKESELIQIIEN